MSKLIVEMEMPKGCTWTDENENGHLCPLLDIDCDCALQEKGRKIGWAEQYAKFPIKGVLPEEHGDLIDRDRLEYRVMAETNPFGKPTIEYESGIKVMQIIEDAFTVIAAERKDDETTAD